MFATTPTRFILGCLFIFVWSVSALSQTEQIRLKLADGSYMTVDDAWESPQGVWYRRGGLSHLLPKDKVKKIERSTPESVATPAPVASNNDDDHFEVPEMVAKAPSNNNGVYDQPAWIYLKGGARVEADSATQSPAGVWYKRGAMSIFIDGARVDRIEIEDPATVAQVGKKERGWSTGRPGLDALIRQNGYKYNVDPYLIFLVMEQESHFNTHAVSPKGARGLMQLMPGTGARFGVRRPHDPAQNISGGTRYLRELLNRFNNRVDLVLASYNAGEGAVAKFGNKVPPYQETRNYVKKIGYVKQISKRYKRNIVGRLPGATALGTVRNAMLNMNRLLLSACLCLFAMGASAQQPDGPLTNAAVVRLVKAGFKEKTIITIINNRAGDFKLDTDHLIELKRSGVNENIIVAMLSSQMGTVFLDEDEWSGESLFKDLKKSNPGDSKAQAGESIFGSGSSSRSSTRSRGESGGNQNEGTSSGSATVRIIKPQAEAGESASPKLEKTPTLTNEGVIKLVDAGFSEGTIIKRIEESPVDFDLSPGKLDELFKRRVTDAIIAAMRAAMGDK